MNELARELARWGRPTIAVIGDFMLDEYVYGDVARISPEAPVPVLRVSSRESRCGGAGNVAAMLGAMEAAVVCIGVTGRDEAGRRLRDLLGAWGAATDGLLELADGRPTTVKTRYVGLAQHKNPHQILRADAEKADDFPGDLADRLGRTLAEVIGRVDVVVLQDHKKGVLSDGRAEALIARANEADVPVVVDPALLDDFGHYRGATLLCPNRYEASLATGTEIACQSDLRQAAQAILRTTGAKAVAVTLDRDGTFLQTADADGQAIPPARTHEVADGTGAGDAVAALLALGLATGTDLDQTVQLANIAGGLEVERFGVVPVTRLEIAQELRHIIGLRGGKILDAAALATELDRRRDYGETIVFTNGCFDLLHIGHVMVLQQARELGTCLVVAINSDDSVRRLKGPSRPVIGGEERARMLAALECVDYVTVYDDDTPKPLLRQLRPDVLVKGGSTGHIVGREIVEDYGGRVKRLDLVDGWSTTDIIHRVMDSNDE
ncbi:MAG: adenylyltransferase/cytidyltransferase family protein [Planctomycetes bacterium]|jgi:D-beta-D-heptose 7-phosphate kinase/D-beta-D-heptose 1-phosphate adenosyltransferase|nr:adenylyltransferase/cytidyltransferase family protein [Planctomycetota bacterium]